LFGVVVLHFSTGRKCPKWKNKERLGKVSATNPLPFSVRWRQPELPRTTHTNQTRTTKNARFFLGLACKNNQFFRDCGQKMDFEAKIGVCFRLVPRFDDTSGQFDA
jgi:hypothetical protein